MSDLLAMALAQLAAAGVHANRRACWLARAAMEETIDDLLAARGLAPGERASGRSKLTCLEVAYADRPRIASRAQYAWSRLSEACHQHAYQLSPTYSETKHLLDLVASFTETPADGA